MIPSAYADTFARDHLPPKGQWPDLIFELPDYRYPDRLNCVTELLDRWLANTQAVVPGTRMNFRVANAKDRADIIAFLQRESGR